MQSLQMKINVLFHAQMVSFIMLQMVFLLVQLIVLQIVLFLMNLVCVQLLVHHQLHIMSLMKDVLINVLKNIHIQHYLNHIFVFPIALFNSLYLIIQYVLMNVQMVLYSHIEINVSINALMVLIFIIIFHLIFSNV